MKHKYAVLTNDMQVAIANKHKERKIAVNKFLPNMIFFLDKMRQFNIPVIHLQFVLDGKAKDGYENYGDFPPLLPGTDGIKILPEVLSANDLVVVKHKDSGFFETTLDETLKKMNVDSLIVSGMQTQICVQTTAADAYFRGYNVIVAPELVGSTRAEDTEASIKWMGNYCAKIVPMNDIIHSFENDCDIK